MKTMPPSLRSTAPKARSADALVLAEFGVAFGERIVLSDVSLRVPARGVTVLIGPGGTGKSTLLRTIAGFNSANPSLRVWGEASCSGLPLGDGEGPALVSQSARLMMASIFENVVHHLPDRHARTQREQRDVAMQLLDDAGLDALSGRLDEPVVSLPLSAQRHLAILRLAAADPRLLCIDEPTTGLDSDSAAALLKYVKQESRRRAVLVVLHNQAHARALGGHTALLAGGRIQETQRTSDFFVSPNTRPAKEFVRNGSCSVASPGARPEELDAEAEPPAPVPEAARHYVSEACGPRGFLWLKNGQLAGCPRPGIILDLNYDLAALQRVGVTVLISLTTHPVDPDALGEYNIEGVWFPIRDMCAPGIEQAQELCRRIDLLLATGHVVAVHCRAGLGRTGTILASYLIWEGASALDALEAARRVEPRWVQSEEQAAFLEEFALAVANNVAVGSAGTKKARSSSSMNENR